jgi:hypothetical protein
MSSAEFGHSAMMGFITTGEVLRGQHLSETRAVLQVMIHCPRIHSTCTWNFRLELPH